MRLSIRNQLSGTITSVELGAVTAIVKVRLDGGDQVVTASITKDAAEDLALEVGTPRRGLLTGHPKRAEAAPVDCARVKCVALTFDDGPSPYTDRLLQILRANNAPSTFFLIGNKVAANPAGATRIADAGMEVASHTWEHPNMTTIPPELIAGQLTKANDAIAAATGVTPTLYRPAGGLSNDAVRSAAQRLGMAEILWDVIPFDWVNDANTAATIDVLKAQIKPG